MVPTGVSLEISDGPARLPFFNPDLETAGAPSAVHAWRRAVAESAALLIATPEYGHSLPGALKNAIDWLIGSGELYGKPVAITAAVPDETRGLRGLAALRTTLAAVDARVVFDRPILRADLEEGAREIVTVLVREALR